MTGRTKYLQLAAAEINARADGPPLRNFHGFPHHALKETAEEIIAGMKQSVTHAGPQDWQISQSDILKAMEIARVIKVEMRRQNYERKFCQAAHNIRNVAHAGASIEEQCGALSLDQVIPVDLVKARLADGVNS